MATLLDREEARTLEINPLTDDAKAQAEAWWATSIIGLKPGEIRLRGYPIEQLIGNVSYVETVWMMLRGELPSKAEAALLEDRAGRRRSITGLQAPAVAIARMAVTAGNDLNHALGSSINVLGDVHGGARPAGHGDATRLFAPAWTKGAVAWSQAVDDELYRLFRPHQAPAGLRPSLPPCRSACAPADGPGRGRGQGRHGQG